MEIGTDNLKHALIYWEDRNALPKTVSLDYETDGAKTIFELRIFDKKRARIERRELCDYNPEKRRYETMLPAAYRDIEGARDVKTVAKQFLDTARTITLNPGLSSYNSDTYYL